MKSRTMNRVATLLLGGAFLLAGCATEREQAPEGEMGESPGEGAAPAADTAEPAAGQQDAAPAGNRVEVEIMSAEGDPLGSAAVEDQDDGVVVRVSLSGLEPGSYGFHFHETGSCDPPDFESAGGHFDPEDSSHGFEDPEGPHAGDLPNVEAEADGTVEMEIFNARTSLDELRDGDGAALILHAEPDDYLSDPSGDSGERIACGMLPNG